LVSVDMLRIKSRVPLNVWDRIHGRLLSDPDIECWIDSRINCYRYNYVFRKGDAGSYYFAYKHNSEKQGNFKFFLVVEFNPNKCELKGLLRQLIDLLGEDFEVVLCDIAWDFYDMDIRSISVDKGKKKVLKTFDYGGDDITYYIGEGDGRVKIYNKAREEKVEGSWVRYEVTWYVREKLSNIEHWYPREDAPKLYYYSQQELSFDPTLDAIMYAVERGYPLNRLSRRYKEKALKCLKARSEVSIDFKEGRRKLLDLLNYITLRY